MMILPPRSRGAQLFEHPTGEIVSTYDRYADVQHALNVLAHEGFPVKTAAVVGNGVRSVERVTGRMTYGRVALSGAMFGSYMGLFFGLLMSLWMPDGTFGRWLAAGFVIGLGVGVLLAVINYAVNRNRPEYASSTVMVAQRFDLLVPAELLHDARRILTEHAARDAEAHADSSPRGFPFEE